MVISYEWTGDGNANTFRGGSANDILRGAAGNDTLSGGGGNDTFRYSTGDTQVFTANPVAAQPLINEVYSGMELITDINTNDILSFLSVSLISDSNGVVGQGEILTVAGYYQAGAFTVGGVDGTTSTPNATLVLFDGASTADVQLEGFVLMGSFRTALITVPDSSILIGTDLILDSYVGTSGVDTLLGDDLNNYLFGGADNDNITGDLGADTLRGGAGQDTFVYNRWNEGLDTILDFTAGVGGDVLYFNDSGPLELHPNGAGFFDSPLVYSEGQSTDQVTTNANVIVITNAQSGLTSAAAVDSFLSTLSGRPAGGVIAIFKTSESGDAQVWYDYRVGVESAPGASTSHLATLVGLTDLSTLYSGNFVLG